MMSRRVSFFSPLRRVGHFPVGSETGAIIRREINTPRKKNETDRERGKRKRKRTRMRGERERERERDRGCCRMRTTESKSTYFPTLISSWSNQFPFSDPDSSFQIRRSLKKGKQASDREKDNGHKAPGSPIAPKTTTTTTTKRTRQLDESRVKPGRRKERKKRTISVCRWLPPKRWTT